MNYKLLVIIPARKGSSGIINKNLIKLNGKPLVFYSLQAAKEIIEKKKDNFLFY